MMMRKPEIDSEVEFPLTVTFEDGSAEDYSDQPDLEMNLEDFDSNDPQGCSVTDARGREVELVLKLLQLKSLKLKTE